MLALPSVLLLKGMKADEGMTCDSGPPQSHLSVSCAMYSHSEINYGSSIVGSHQA